MSMAVNEQVSTSIPEVRFQPPDYETARKHSTKQYRYEVARAIADASALGLAEPNYLAKPGAKLLPLTDMGAATALVDRLVESDFDTRAWLAVNEWLSPEINQCITCLRRMIAQDQRSEAGHWITALRGRIESVRAEAD